MALGLGLDNFIDIPKHQTELLTYHTIISHTGTYFIKIYLDRNLTLKMTMLAIHYGAQNV